MTYTQKRKRKHRKHRHKQIGRGGKKKIGKSAS